MTEAEITQRRLRWKCRRGMLELDILLLNYFDANYDALSDQDKKLFARVLELEDSELYACIMHSKTVDDQLLMEMIDKISKVNLS